MINFSFKIKNPWPKDNSTSSIWNKTGNVSEFKGWETEFYYCRDSVFGIGLDTSWRGSDHAGPELELSLLGFVFVARIYDIRHWDYDKQNWQMYE